MRCKNAVMAAFHCSAFFGAAFFGAAGEAGASEVLPTYRVEGQSEAVMQSIARDFEVIRRLDDGRAFEIVVPEGKLAALLKLAPTAKPHSKDLHGELRSMTKAERELYDVASMERRLRAFVEQYPQLVKLETYGTSRGGRPEYVLTLAKNARQPDPTKPVLMLTSATHGDEVVTVEVTLGLIEKLLRGYGTDERLTRMVDNTTMLWVPAVCVDGFAARSRYVDGRDPNRDYAWPEQPNRQPQTQCVRHITQFFDARPEIKGTMDFHAAGSMIMFPWAYTYERLPAETHEVFDRLTTYMAEDNGFAHGTIAETIYVARGSSADYYHWKTGALATAIEVSHNFAPAREALRSIVDENTESTWRFIEHFVEK